MIDRIDIKWTVNTHGIYVSSDETVGQHKRMVLLYKSFYREPTTPWFPFYNSTWGADVDRDINDRILRDQFRIIPLTADLDDLNLRFRAMYGFLDVINSYRVEGIYNEALPIIRDRFLNNVNVGELRLI